jgi:hypothetical protein
MISISYDIIESAIRHFKSDLKKHESAVVNALIDFYMVGDLCDEEKEYVVAIMDNLHSLIVGQPEKLERLKIKFDNIIPYFIIADKANESFRNKLLDCLGYSKRRSDFYPKYFNRLGIKTCVYCNAQMAVTVESTKNESIAKFQVDHYIPKSIYPGLSISLYNLYPACSNCNNPKRAKDVYFLLYKKVADTSSSFVFRLDLKSLGDYFATQDPDVIKFTFSEPSAPTGYHSFSDVFNIQGIYDTQKDIIEELIQKSQVYSPTYKDRLVRKFPTVFTNAGMLNRLLIGNYTDESHLHKRPMAKFMIDISRQVGLI